MNSEWHTQKLFILFIQCNVKFKQNQHIQLHQSSSKMSAFQDYMSITAKPLLSSIAKKTLLVFSWEWLRAIIPRLLSKLNKKARSKLLQIQSCWIKIKLLMRASVPFLFCLLPNTTVSEMALELFQIKNILLLSSKIF